MGPIGGNNETNGNQHQFGHGQGGHQGRDENVAELCDKLLQNLSSVFEKDELLDEFDIIPCESRLNQSPVLHDQQVHKLALESWCVPYLYKHSYYQFLWLCRKGRKSSIQSTTPTTVGPPPPARDSGNGNNNSAASSVVTKREKELSRKLSCLSESERVSRGLMLSRILIIINPDLALAWNYRRDAFVPSTLEVLEKEQRLVALVMSRKPKCPEGFTYRRWLIRKALQRGLVEPSRIEHFISQEIDMIEQPIRRYSTNYHAWSYRHWLLELVLAYDKTIVARDQKEALLDRELQKSNTWIKSNVSDYSGCHYRQKLLESILNLRSDGISLLVKELDDNEKRIFLYEGHESLWHHRRAILQLLLSRLQKEMNGNNADIVLTFPPNSTSMEKLDSVQMMEKRLQQKESDLVQQVELKNCDTSECSQLNYSLCQAHVKWMTRRLKWDLTKSVHLEL